jgi:hypothetical protein
LPGFGDQPSFGRRPKPDKFVELFVVPVDELDERIAGSRTCAM